MCPPTAFDALDSVTPHPSVISRDFLPATTISKAAFQLASSLLPPAILNHSVRVYLYCKALAEQSKSVYATDKDKHDLLFTACIMHDIGTTSKYDGAQRFEVEGADAAVSLLTDLGVAEDDAHQVWMAIALHTSPGIAERINQPSQLVREAVLIDFGRREDSLGNLVEVRRQLEERYPRRGIEKVLGDAVVAQAVRDPKKAPAASWPNNLYKAYLAEPDWEGVNKGF